MVDVLEFVVDITTYIREAAQKKTLFLGYLSQMWEGGVADSQTRSKPLKPPQIAPKIAFFDPNFTFRFPKSHKNPGLKCWNDDSRNVWN